MSGLSNPSLLQEGQILRRASRIVHSASPTRREVKRATMRTIVTGASMGRTTPRDLAFLLPASRVDGLSRRGGRFREQRVLADDALVIIQEGSQPVSVQLTRTPGGLPRCRIGIGLRAFPRLRAREPLTEIRRR
jgi:hypothetical protein